MAAIVEDHELLGDLFPYGFRRGEECMLTASLIAFQRAAATAIGQYGSAKEAQHGQTRSARNRLIDDLTVIFDECYAGSGERELSKIDFVKRALEAAGIPPPGFNGRAAAASSRLVRRLRQSSMERPDAAEGSAAWQAIEAAAAEHIKTHPELDRLDPVVAKALSVTAVLEKTPALYAACRQELAGNANHEGA